MSTGTLVALISWQSLNPSDQTYGQFSRRVLTPGTANLAKNTWLENIQTLEENLHLPSC